LFLRKLLINKFRHDSVPILLKKIAEEVKNIADDTGYCTLAVEHCGTPELQVVFWKPPIQKI
jgi:hypothetical protein